MKIFLWITVLLHSVGAGTEMTNTGESVFLFIFLKWKAFRFPNADVLPASYSQGWNGKEYWMFLDWKVLWHLSMSFMYLTGCLKSVFLPRPPSFIRLPLYSSLQVFFRHTSFFLRKILCRYSFSNFLALCSQCTLSLLLLRLTLCQFLFIFFCLNSFVVAFNANEKPIPLTVPFVMLR